MSEGKELALIDRARTALAEARTLGEVIEIRDQAAALQHYAAKKQGAQEAERYANELRIRAERKIGEITRTMRKHPAGRASAGFTPTDGDDRPKLERLAEHGLTTQDASRFERLASVPEAEFERSVTAREATRTKIASAVPPRQRRGRVARATRKVRFKEPGTDPRAEWLESFANEAKGYCTKHADSFAESIRELARHAAVLAKAIRGAALRKES